MAANVLSLMANIFTGERFILRFYSGNFDNFKIIEKLLNRKTIKKYNQKEIKESQLFYPSSIGT